MSASEKTSSAFPAPPRTAGRRRDAFGHLVIIGGGEDKENKREILQRFLELSGGPGARIALLTAASGSHDDMCRNYLPAFEALGSAAVTPIVTRSRAEATDPERARVVAEADGIFMTGGDQRRLLSVIGGTPVASSMHRAFREGACVAGTSAGASAMSDHMLAESAHLGLHPARGMMHLAAGLGFLRRVMIDQHFSERQRMSRLLSVVAENPYLLGIGIDEDTALVVDPNAGIEVLGEGGVTVIDGREMTSNFLEVEQEKLLYIANVRLHLFPHGFTYRLDAGEEGSPVQEIVAVVSSVH